MKKIAIKIKALYARSELKCIAALMILFIFAASPAAAQAPAGSAGAVEAIISQAPDPGEDVAAHWIQMLFGDVVFAAWGGPAASSGVDATVLANSAGFVNVAALILGITIVIYVSITGLINTGLSGQVLGEKWSATWLSLRTAAAFLLITPNAIFGGALSIIQVAVLSLIVIGSNAGTFLWNKVGDMITTGGAIVATTPAVGSGSVKNMLTSLVCAEHSYNYVTRYRQGDGIIAEIKYPGGFAGFSNTYERIPGPALGATFNIKPGAKEIRFGESGECGSIGLSWSDDRDKDKKRKKGREHHAIATEQAEEAARESLSSILTDLSVIASVIVLPEREGGLGGGLNMKRVAAGRAAGRSDASQRWLEMYDKVLVAYNEIVRKYVHELPLAVTRASTGDESISKKWKDELTSGGWGNAGVWYFDLTRFQSLNHSIVKNIDSSISEPSAPDFCEIYSPSRFRNSRECSFENEIVAGDMSYGVGIVHSASTKFLSANTSRSDNESAALLKDAQLALSDIEALDPKIDGANRETILNKINTVLVSQLALQFVSDEGSYFSNGMSGEVSVTSTDGMTNPFRTVTGVGHALNTVSVAAFGAGFVASIAERVLDVIGNAGLGLGGFTGAPAGSGVAAWLSKAILAIIAVLIPLGWTLAFFVPFFPIITWIRLVLAYLLTVIEAVVASPLAVIMMATPEGEGISGTRLERSIQLMAAVILKPTLLVIGLVASLALAYVGFAILNLLFWQTTEVVTNAGFFELIAVLVIYTITALEVTKGAVMVMQKLPDQILDWMAGGVGGRSFGDSAEAGVQQGLSEVKGGLGSVSTAVMSSSQGPSPRAQGRGDDDKSSGK